MHSHLQITTQLCFSNETISAYRRVAFSLCTKVCEKTRASADEIIRPKMGKLSGRYENIYSLVSSFKLIRSSNMEEKKTKNAKYLFGNYRFAKQTKHCFASFVFFFLANFSAQFNVTRRQPEIILFAIPQPLLAAHFFIYFFFSRAPTTKRTSGRGQPYGERKPN